MTCCSVAALILSALICVSCSVQQGARYDFSNSLRLTRTIRARVQQLLLLYKQQQFGDSLFEDRTLMMNTLPPVTISYHTWLRMEDIERLSAASRDLNTFWTHLDRQRQVLDLDRGEEREGGAERATQRRNKRGRPQLSLSRTVLKIQLDLRDLMRQVNSQLANMKTKQEATTDYTSTPAFTSLTHPTSAFSSPKSSEKPSGPAATSSQTSSSAIPSMAGPRSTLGLILTSAAVNAKQTVSGGTEEVSSSEGASTTTAAEPNPTTQVSGPSRWVSRLEGYVILRDLERYLSRLARDYTLLRGKY